MIETLKTYRSVYNLAYDMAKRAEVAYARDSLDRTSRFIEPGNWNAGYKGLGAADRLLEQLKALDRAYWD